MDLGLNGKVAIVTGSTGGIGLAICDQLLAEGASVAAFSRGGDEKLEPILEMARGRGLGDDTVLPVLADLTEPEGVERGFERVLEHWGRVDVVVNNAGATLEAPFLLLSDVEARRLTEVNLWGPMHLTRLALKPMIRARSGSIVNVTSVVASRGGRGVAVYAMTKAALEALTRVLALEMAPKGIRLNAVAPGLIETSLSSRVRQRLGDEVMDYIALSRVGLPREVATAVVWLASEVAAGYVTGQVLQVDGGFSL